MQKILILIVVNLIVYFRCINYEWIIDDQLVPKGKGKNIFHTFLLQLHALKYSNYQIEHLQRILVHTINCVLIYFVFGQSDISFMAALLFSVNAGNSQSVCWLNGVGYSMSAMCVLLMAIWPAWSFMPYFYSMFWHVTAVFAPLLFLMKVPHYPIVYILIFPLLGWLINWKIPLFKAQENATLNVRWKAPNKAMRKQSLRKSVFIIKSYGYLFFMGLLPRRLGLYHEFGYSYGLHPDDTKKWERMSPLFWCGLITLATNLFLIFRFWGSPLSYALYWHGLFIGMWCNIVIAQQPMAERYLYLSNAGLMYGLAWLCFQTPYTYIIIAVFGTFYLAKLLYFMPMYKNMENYIEYSINEFPHHFALWNWKGILARDKNYLFSAMAGWAMGLRYRPTDFRLNFNLGKLMGGMGYLAEANKYFLAAGDGLIAEEGGEEAKKELVKARAIIQKRIEMHEAGKSRIIRPGGLR